MKKVSISKYLVYNIKICSTLRCVFVISRILIKNTQVVKKLIVCLWVLVTYIYCISAYLLSRILVSLRLDIDRVPGQAYTDMVLTRSTTASLTSQTEESFTTPQKTTKLSVSSSSYPSPRKLPMDRARADQKSFVCEICRNVSSKSTVISDSLISFSSFPKSNEFDANLNVV